MNEEYQISIITPNGSIFDKKITSVVAPGKYGYLGIWAHHTAMVTILREGVCTIREQNTKTYYAIENGVLEVNHRGDVLILTDGAIETKSFEEAHDKASNHAIL